jgi:hypothetical protein
MPIEDAGHSARKPANAGPDHEPKLSRRNLRAAAVPGVPAADDEPAEALAVWPLDEVQKAALGRMLGMIDETGRDPPVG